MLRPTYKHADPITLVRPSFSTLTPDAFSWHVGPWLSDDQKQELQTLWDSLPAFDPTMPNRDLSDPELPADPEELDEGEWSWKGCYQPLRWFFCACVLHKHDCAFTGEPPAECTGWHDFCCKEVCAVLLSGGPFSCLPIARSVPMGPPQISCTLGRFVRTCTKARHAHGDCYVIFGTALTWKPRASSIALFHHRKFVAEDTTRAQYTWS